MKKLMIFFLVVLASCQIEQTIVGTNKNSEMGRLKFSVLPVGESQLAKINEPAYAVLNIKNASGRVFQGEKLGLHKFGKMFETDVIKLKAGDYTLIGYQILDATDVVICNTSLPVTDLTRHLYRQPIPFALNKNADFKIIVGN